MRKAHLIVGGLFVLVFLATGFYMAIIFSEAREVPVDQRVMYRSTHVYILLCSLVNCAVGCYFVTCCDYRLRIIQHAGSLVMLVSPAIITIAFFVEPEPGQLSRPITLAGIVAVTLGVMLHAFSFLQDQGANQSSPGIGQMGSAINRRGEFEAGPQMFQGAKLD